MAGGCGAMFSDEYIQRELRLTDWTVLNVVHCHENLATRGAQFHCLGVPGSLADPARIAAAAPFGAAPGFPGSLRRRQRHPLQAEGRQQARQVRRGVPPQLLRKRHAVRRCKFILKATYTKS